MHIISLWIYCINQTKLNILWVQLFIRQMRRLVIVKMHTYVAMMMMFLFYMPCQKMGTPVEHSVLYI